MDFNDVGRDDERVVPQVQYRDAEPALVPVEIYESDEPVGVDEVVQHGIVDLEHDPRLRSRIENGFDDRLVGAAIVNG